MTVILRKFTVKETKQKHKYLNATNFFAWMLSCHGWSVGSQDPSEDSLEHTCVGGKPGTVAMGTLCDFVEAGVLLM